MALLGGAGTNFVLAGMWNKVPWRVWLHEPSDSLAPSQWILSSMRSPGKQPERRASPPSTAQSCVPLTGERRCHSNIAQQLALTSAAGL
jgi:hypothetical protein